MKEQAIVYVDGFNLYKSALQKRLPDYKWLDVQKLADLLLPNLDVISVKYFAAELKPRADDPRIVDRQRAYLRALAECDRTEVTLGHFQLHRTWLPVHPLTVDKDTGRTVTVQVVRPEEKGSDVNLASAMLFDAFDSRADVFVLLSNDSDFVAPLQIVRENLDRKTGIIFPTEHVSKRLISTKPAFTRHIREGSLSASQLPDVLTDRAGRLIRKPEAWGKS